MLEDARPKVVLTQQRLVDSLPGNGVAILSLDAERERLGRESGANVESGVGLDHLAYVIYTSGSTGKPKGTLVTHRNVARLFQSTQEWFHFGAEDVWTLFHSHAFDFSVWELWGALAHGGRLVVVPYLVSRSPDAFYELLSKERVTVLNQTPSAFRQLIHAEQGAGKTLALALRLVIFGGEALEMQSLKPWFDRHGDQHPQLVNMYGITETTVHVTYRPLSSADLKGGSVIGIPIPDLKVYILDRNGQLAPIGVPGELYVGGAGVARGYLNRPELTAEKFLVNPFNTKPGDRLYRSGDLARYLPNRDLEYLGRIDDQVKIRGFRIELGEIESVLAGLPGVREALLVVREDVPGDKRLVAYVTAKNGQPPKASDLRGLLRAKLPEYMVPSTFVTLEQFPLTPHGKVDRKVLPRPESGSSEREFVPPVTPTEVLLAKTWSEVLGVERIGLEDNFFDLGGHSLLATRLVSRIRNAFQSDLGLGALLQSPTLGGLAAVIDQGGTNGTQPAESNQRPPPLSSVPIAAVAKPALVLSSPVAPNRRPTLTPLNARTEGPTLILQIGDGSIELYNLAALLKEECSLHAALAPVPEAVIVASTREDYAKLPSMEEMAAVQADLIKGKKFQGPLILTGFCFRGMLAYETARQLRAAGVEVAGVILLDTWMRRRSRLWRRKIWLMGHIRTALKEGPGYVWKKLQKRVEFEKDRFVGERELIRSGSFDQEVPWVVMERIYLNAMRRYRPQPLDCRGVVIESKEDWWVGANRQDPTLGAGSLFEGKVEVMEIAGNHLGVIDRPSLPELARAYREALRLFTANNVPKHPQPRPGLMLPLSKVVAGRRRPRLWRRSMTPGTSASAIGRNGAGASRRVDSEPGVRLQVMGGRSPNSNRATPPGTTKQTAVPRPAPSSAVPGPPLFLIPGLEGDAYFPPTLVRRIGSLRLCQDGLEYPGLRGREAPARQVEEIARHLIHQIQQRCPRGPYGLCGYSFGGTMAYEMACQMRSLGLEVDALILWDTLPQRCKAHYRRSFRDAMAELALRWRRRNAAGRTRLLWQVLDTKIGSGLRKIRGISGLIVPETPREICARASILAARSYQPRPYDGDLVLFRASELGGIFNGATLIPGLGWESIVRGKIEEFQIPGCHLDIREEPSYSILAQKTADWLRDQAESKQPVGREMASCAAQG